MITITSFPRLRCLTFAFSLIFGMLGVATGAPKTETCVACHGVDGNSAVPTWPKLAGQHEQYLVKQLKDFRLGEKGPRYDPSMYPMVAALSDQDIIELAAFYASQTQVPGKARMDAVALGSKIYRGGNMASGVAACSGCHGPNAKGNAAANFPRLSGQHADYLATQLRKFKEGQRTNSAANMMSAISHRLTEEEIKAVSSYIEGLN